jgi:hypothetical protein
MKPMWKWLKDDKNRERCESSTIPNSELVAVCRQLRLRFACAAGLLALLATSTFSVPTPDVREMSCVVPVTGLPGFTADTGGVHYMRELPGVGVLIKAERGWFLAGSANGKATVEPAGEADTGMLYEMHELPGVGVLIKAVLSCLAPYRRSWQHGIGFLRMPLDGG